MLAKALTRHAVVLAVLVQILGPGLAAQQVSQPPAPPDQTQQEEILARASEYADNYISRLPDFICIQKTGQFQGNKKGEKWKQGDTIDSRLVFADGREKRTLEAVNGHAPSPGMHRLRSRPLTTEGEFGVLLANVLGSGSNADFHWQGWQNLGGRHIASFAYSMDREHSTLKLSLSDLAQAVVPYHGIVYADPANGEVWRISSEANEIPEQLDTRSIATTIDYRRVSIGGQDYLMPSRATVLLLTRSKSVRNELSFGGFQKFEAGSTINFGDPGDGGKDTPPPTNSPPR